MDFSVLRHSAMKLLLALRLALVAGHGALYIPTPRNSIDRMLPEFRGGRSPMEACTCNNGNGNPNTGCELSRNYCSAICAIL